MTTQAQRLAIEFPKSEYFGIRDVDYVNPQAYRRVRAKMPAEPQQPSVDSILEGMIARLGIAYEKYDDCHLQTGKKTRVG